MKTTHLASFTSCLAVTTAVMLTAPAAMAFEEGPATAAMVAAGTLPAVDDRLPTNPKVIEAVSEIGAYGGVMNSDLLGGTDRGYGWLQRFIGYERLLQWNRSWSAVEPHIAERFEASDDASTYTFYLREGMKWSDGEDFTADDILFWWEHVANNEELAPGGPGRTLVIAGEPAKVEKIDDYAVRFTFAAPYGQFPQQVAAGWSETMALPEHYARQFHKDTNPDGIDQLVADAGVDTWVDLFSQRVGGMGLQNIGAWANPERPTIYAWKVTTPYTGASTETVFERNPYYWKVDAEGNQLPYLDAMSFSVIQDAEVLKLKTLNGEMDFVYRPQIFGTNDKSLFFDGQEQGGYHLIDLVEDKSTAAVIHLNLTHQDPVKHQLFNDKDFRIALSHAINRQEIIDVVFVSQGEPYQVSPRPESPFFDDSFAKQYTEYDPDLANEMLDAAGYSERDGNGFRLGPDGNRIAFTVDVRTTNGEQIDVLELVQQHMKAVGIDMRPNVIDSAFYKERQLQNVQDAVSNVGAGGLGAMLNARLYVPINNNALYAIPWSDWYNNNEIGIEPPEQVKYQLSLYDQMLGSADAETQNALFSEIIDIAKEQFYHIGINLITPRYSVVSNRMGNVADSMPASFTYPTPGPQDTSHWFIRN